MPDALPAFILPSRRYRLFFDETGNGDLKSAKDNPNERYLSVTGVIIRQDIHDGYVTRRLNRLKRDLFPGGQDVVLHRRDMMRREGAFKVLNNDQLRREFDARLAALISEVSAPVFTISIDKKAHLERYRVWQHSPYHYVLQCLAERFVLWLERTNSCGDMVGEARNETHDIQLRRAFRRFYRHGTDWVRPPLIQRRLTSGELRLQEKPANIAGLQLADVLAHPAHRAFKFMRLREVPPDDYGTFLARALERLSYDRHPTNETVEGYGRKWLP
jgi:hypothetical protein